MLAKTLHITTPKHNGQAGHQSDHEAPRCGPIHLGRWTPEAAAPRSSC